MDQTLINNPLGDQICFLYPLILVCINLLAYVIMNNEIRQVMVRLTTRIYLLVIKENLPSLLSLQYYFKQQEEGVHPIQIL